MSDQAPDKDKLLDALLQSPSYRRADEDLEFLGRDELRAIRLQLELLKPELAQIQEGIHSTIVVFGSARLVEPAEARAPGASGSRARAEAGRSGQAGRQSPSRAAISPCRPFTIRPASSRASFHHPASAMITASS